MESAGLKLLKDDPADIIQALKLAKATPASIRKSLLLAFVYNSLDVRNEAGLLNPVFGPLLSSMLAAAAMSLSSVSVIYNALRLRHLKLQCPEFEVRRLLQHTQNELQIKKGHWQNTEFKCGFRISSSCSRQVKQ